MFTVHGTYDQNHTHFYCQGRVSKSFHYKCRKFYFNCCWMTDVIVGI